MGRPETLRRVGHRVRARGFKPVGRPASDLEAVSLRLDELEAVRLADLEGLYQEAAAERMGVSRATFARVLARARSVIAEAIVLERLLLIADGPVVVGDHGPESCPLHDGPRRRGRGCRCGRGRRKEPR